MASLHRLHASPTARQNKPASVGVKYSDLPRFPRYIQNGDDELQLAAMRVHTPPNPCGIAQRHQQTGQRHPQAARLVTADVAQ